MPRPVIAVFSNTVINAMIASEPEFTENQKGTMVCRFDVAVAQSFGAEDETMFMTTTAFGRTAELISKCKYTKGEAIHFQYKPRCQVHEKDGRKYKNFSWVIEKILFPKPRKNTEEGKSNVSEKTSVKEPVSKTDSEDDDIPF